MVEQAKSWIRDNSTLVLFLVAQLIAIGAAAASILAYSVRLETRVSIMETRGAEYTVARMDELRQRLTVLEQNIKKNQDSIDRIVEHVLKDMQQRPTPR
jgi:uncharacterized coiled-coil protein SlyX